MIGAGRAGRDCRKAMICAVLLLLGNSANASAQSLRGNEQEMKTAFLVNFSKLVEWPANAFPEDNGPIRLCVAESIPIATRLEQIMKGKVIGTHPVLLTSIRTQEEARQCHLLFVGGADPKTRASLLQAVRGSPVLTVGESNGFVQAGGVINFYLQADGLRFEINLDAAQRANLKINSRVLALASLVRERSAR